MDIEWSFLVCAMFLVVVVVGAAMFHSSKLTRKNVK